VPRSARAANGGLLIGGIVAIAIGAYGLLDSTAPRYLGLPMLLGGVCLGWIGVMASGRRVERSRYRPDPWRLEEWGVSLVGVTVAAVIIAVSTSDLTALHPSLQPLRWPELPLLPAAAILLGILPAWIAPPVRLPAARRPPVLSTPLEQVA
jgi:energy-coupling factor transport system permease protein